jgi:hypothetical protein
VAEAWEEVFQRQEDIQGLVFDHQFRRMSDPEKIVFVKEMVLAITHELHEALDETGWKAWSTSRHFHKDLYLRELVDVQLMLINLFLVTGVRGSELSFVIADLMSIKQQLNIQRQESGY